MCIYKYHIIFIGVHNMNNPLQKFFRQPKVYISLPSKGMFYPENALAGDHSNMPVFSMTGMDEILFKTPDALFNGESTTKVIESCCPYIKSGLSVPSVDIDTILIGIRIATYGEMLSFEHICTNCGHDNNYEVNLNNILDYFTNQTFNGIIDFDNLQIIVRPLNYKEITEFNVENFKLQKMLFQLNKSSLDDDSDQESVKKLQNEIYQKIAEIQVNLFIQSIESVNFEGNSVTDKELITEWLQNSEKEFFQRIKERLEKNKEQWNMPKQHVACENCQHETDIEVTLDPSNFFGRN